MATSFDTKLLEPLLKRAEETHSDAVVVMHKGELVGTWRFGKPKEVIETMSVTKSIVNFAFGRLITKGLLAHINEPVCTFYPEWRQGRKKNITIKHIMNHVSGLQNAPNTNIEIYPSPDFVQLALCAELSHEPGTTVSYNNKAVNLLSGIVEKISGRKLDEFMRTEIFTLLTIEEFYWIADDSGNPQAMSGLGLLPEDLAKLGQLFLNRGAWQGQQIIDATWFDTITSQKLGEVGLLWWLVYDVSITINDTHITNLRAANVSEDIVEKLETLKGNHTLGSFWTAFQTLFGEAWRDTRTNLETIKYRDVIYGELHGYRAEGYLGQYLYIFLKQELVFVRMIHYSSYQDEQDSFGNFGDMVLDIAKSL
jgi:CubicO group peptidase (beta-lactamase class C family)